MKNIILSLLMFFAAPISIYAQYYYVNAYEPIEPRRENGPADLYLKAINLNTHSIEQNIKLKNKGSFTPKIPISVNVGNHQYLLSLSEDCMHSRVSYSLFEIHDNQIDLVREAILEGVMLDGSNQYQGEEGFRFGLCVARDRKTILPLGLYGLDNNLNFRFLRSVDMSEEPGLIENIGSFEYVIKILLDENNNLYYALYNGFRWLVKLDEGMTSVVDSAQLNFSGGAATLFAYHPDMAKFYCLHVNYEMHTGNVASDSIYKRRVDYYVNPDVVIYDPVTLDILEQHTITDYPEGEYPGQEDGLAEVVGDFIVYYFFNKDEAYRYDPAMLFIFDTRTNETTWLRVGWR